MAPSFSDPKVARALQRAEAQARERFERERHHLGLHRDKTEAQTRQVLATYSQQAGQSLLYHPAFRDGRARWLLEYDPRNPRRANEMGLYEALEALEIEDNRDLNFFTHLIDELLYERAGQGLPPAEAAGKIQAWIKAKSFHDFLRDWSPAWSQPGVSAAASTPPGIETVPAEVEAEAEALPPAPAAAPETKPAKDPSKPRDLELKFRPPLEQRHLNEIAKSLGLVDGDYVWRLPVGSREQGKLSGFLAALVETGAILPGSKKLLKTKLHSAFCYRFKAPYVVKPKDKQHDRYEQARQDTVKALATLGLTPIAKRPVTKPA